MDPELVAKRRSTIFQRIQIELTHGTIIRQRISPGKFPTSSVGVLKLIIILLLISAAITFLTNKTCPKTSDWYTWLFPLATTAGSGITIIFYAVFTLGIALKYPRFWFISDIILCPLVALFIIIVSVMTMSACDATGTQYKVPGPLGICGAVLLVIAAAGLYVMYRNKETDKDIIPPPRRRPRGRPSVRHTDVEV